MISLKSITIPINSLLSSQKIRLIVAIGRIIWEAYEIFFKYIYIRNDERILFFDNFYILKLDGKWKI